MPLHPTNLSPLSISVSLSLSLFHESLSSSSELTLQLSSSYLSISLACSRLRALKVERFLSLFLCVSLARSLKLEPCQALSLEDSPSLPALAGSTAGCRAGCTATGSQQVDSSKLGLVSTTACASLPKNVVLRQEFQTSSEAYLSEATGPSLIQRQIAGLSAN